MEGRQNTPQNTFGPRQIAEQATQNTLRERRRREQSRRQVANRVEQNLALENLNSSRTFGEAAADFGLSTLQSSVALGESGFGIANFATGGTLDQATGFSENFERTNRILEQAKSDELRFQKQQALQKFDSEGILSGASEFISNPRLGIDLLAGQSASLLPGAAAGRLATTARAASNAARGVTGTAAAQATNRTAARAISGTVGAQAAGNANVQAVNQARREGLSEEEAQNRGLQAAALTGPTTAAIGLLPGIGAAGTEASVISRLSGQGVTRVGASGTGSGVVRAAGRGAEAVGRETAEEALQSGGEQLAQNVVSDARGLTDDLAVSTTLGSIAGGGLGLGLGAVQAPGTLRTEIDTARREAANDLGRPDAGDSTLEREGQRSLTAEQVLFDNGFTKNANGRFENEEIAPGQEFDEADALQLAEIVSGQEINLDEAAPEPESNVDAGRTFTEEELQESFGDDRADPIEQAREIQSEDDLLAASGFVQGDDGNFRRSAPNQSLNELDVPLSREQALLQASADQIEVQEASEAQDLEAAGFFERNDGTFVNPELPDAVFTREEALATAEVQPRLSQQERATGIPLPDVVEGPDVDLTLSEDTGFRAFQKARERAFSVFGEPRPVGESRDPTFQVEDASQPTDGSAPTLSAISEPEAFSILSRLGEITPSEAREATRISEMATRNRQAIALSARTPGPRPGSSRPVTRDDIVRADDAAFRRAADQAGFETEDGQSFFRVDEDGQLIERTRQELSEELNAQRAIPEGEDLVGAVPPQFADVQPTDVTPRPAQVQTPAERQQAQQSEFQFEYLDQIRRDFETRRIGADPSTRIRANWDSLFRQVIRDVNQRREGSGLKKINLNKSSMNSRAMRNLIQRAVDRGIEVDSPESFRFLQEEAERIADQDSVVSEIVNTVSEEANAVSFRVPPQNEARNYLLRRGVSKPGQMRGPVFQRFKQELADNGVRPGTDAFERFMQQFSASLSAQELETAFGAGVRSLYPANTPADVLESLSTPVTEEGAQSALDATSFTPAPEVNVVRFTVFEKAVENSTVGEAAEAKQAVEQGKVEAQQAQAESNEVNRQREEARNEQVQQAASEAEAESRNSAQAARGEMERVNENFRQLVEDSRRAKNAAANGLRNLYRRLLSARSELTLEERVEAKIEQLGENIEERKDPRISGIPKDITDPASWLAFSEAVVESDIYQELDNQTKSASVVMPMIERLYDLANNVTEQHGYQIYKDIMENSPFFDEVLNLRETNPEVLQAATNLQKHIDGLIAQGATDPANNANQKPHKRERGGKFSRLSSEEKGGEPIDWNELNAIVEKANRQEGNYIPVEAVRTAADAESLLGTPVPSDANGVFFGGRAVIINENVRSPEVAYEVIMHERTHGGLEGLLGGERLRAVLNRLQTNPQTRKRIQKKIAAQPELTRLDAAEEVLADMVSAGEILNKSIFSKIRAAIARFSEQVLGVGDLVLSDKAVNELLTDTSNYMKGIRSELDLSEGYLQGLQPYKDVFDGEAVPKGPKFSKVSETLDEFGSRAEKESDVATLSNRHREMMEDVLRRGFSKKEARAQTQGRLRGLVGSISRTAMDAMPLTQLAQLSEGLFVNSEGVDLAKHLRNLKLGKQNEFVKNINKETEAVHNPAGDKNDKRTKKFNISARGVAKEWQEFVNKGSNQSKREALDRVQQDGTFFMLHPELAWDEQSTLDHDTLSFTETDRRKAFDRMKKDWEKMGETAKDIYRKSQAIYSAKFNERIEEIRKQTKRIARDNESMPDPDNVETQIGTGEWLSKVEQKIQLMLNKKRRGPFSPLQRKGDHYVVIRRREDQQVVFSSGHDSFAEAQMTERGMKEQDFDNERFEIAVGKSSQAEPELDGLSQGAYAKLEQALTAAFPENNDTDRQAKKDSLAALQEVFLSTLPDRSLLSHANGRQNIGGAVLDSFRAFNDFNAKTARNISSMKFDNDIQKTLNEIRGVAKADSRESQSTNVKRDDFANAMTRQHAASQDFQKNKVADKITQSAFLFWMSSPSQAALNFSQTALVTIPRLGVKYGAANVGKWALEGAKNFMATKTRGMHDEESTTLDKNSVEFRVLKLLNEDGTLDFTLAHDITDLAQNQTSLTRTRWDKAVEVMSAFAHKSEVLNREAAAFAAIKGEMQQRELTQASLDAMTEQERTETLNDITRIAREGVLSTQFDFSHANKAVLTQGPIKRVVFQFQQFRLNMLGMMAKDVMDSLNPNLSVQKRREAQKTLAAMQLTQLALTGIKGSIAAPIIFSLGNMFQDEDEISDVEEKMTQALPRWATMGVLSGALDTQRFGFQSLLPIIGGRRFMPTASEPNELIEHVMLESLGPVHGLATNLGDGFQDMAAGDYSQGIAKVMPRLFGDAFNVVANEWDGLENSRKVTYYEQGPWDRIANSLGLDTGRQAAANADRNAIFSGKRRASSRRSNLISRWAAATTSAERAEMMTEIEQWNARHNRPNPSLVIGQSSLQRVARNRVDRQRAAARWGVGRTDIPRSIKEMIDGDRNR